MATTKTYIYTENGVDKTVDVTFVTGTAYKVDPPPDGYIAYFEIPITASIPSAIGIDLYVDLDVVVTESSYDSSGTYAVSQQMKLVAGQLSLTENHVASTQESNPDNSVDIIQKDYEYSLADQRSSSSGNTGFTATYTKIDASCFGAKNGSISVAVEGGTAPFTFAWSDAGPNEALRTGLAAGTYSVTITDNAGYQQALSDIVISQPTQIAATFTTVNCSCYGGSNGSINVSSSGGTGTHTFKWNDGSSLKNRSNLSAGAYTLIITDANGCSRSFKITVGQPSQIKITTNVAGRDVSVSVTGGTPSYSYHWNDNVTVKDRINLADGTYTLTVTDANNCQATATVLIDGFKFYFSKNPVTLEVKAESLETKPNLSFQLGVFLEEDYMSGAFNKKYETEHPARTDGSTDFDVREVLNAYLSSEVPVFAEDMPKRVSEAFKRFYLQHNEVYGEPPVAAPFTQVDTFYVLFGGLSTQEFAKNVFFETYLDNQKPFLSWQPKKKETVSQAHEYLHFVVTNKLHTELQLWARIKYKNGVENTVQLRSITGVAPYEVYRFPAGYNQLKIGNLLPGEEVSSYTLYLKAGEALASEERTYKLVPEAPHQKVYLYLNSLGGWDTLLAKGRGKTSLRTAEEVIDRELPVGYAYNTRSQEVSSKSGQLNGNVVIGDLTNAEKRHLIDLAISEQVYEQTASGYLPVRIKFDFDPHDDMEALDQEVSFEVMYPQTNRYTPEL
jgi:hypothetical protein